MARRLLLSLSAALLLTPLVPAQMSVSNADIAKPLQNEWLTYNGDYTAKRYSTLTAVNKLTVKHLSLAWISTMTPGDALA